MLALAALIPALDPDPLRLTLPDACSDTWCVAWWEGPSKAAAWGSAAISTPA
jgi:hypothetical protein